jgi:hypothetical protein
VDYDGDGILDILSGSWPGELTFFRGEGKGKFAAGQKIKDKTGKLIKPDSASTVFCADWNGDALNDLLIGSIEGHVYLCHNEGSARKPAFTRPQKLMMDGKALKTDGDSHPVVADWDNDGKLDLLVGSSDGSVRWYRNVGSASAPRLTPSGRLLAVSKMMQSMNGNGDGNGGGCGMRTKICVTDWNHDGRNDLLVGDFNMMPKKPLTLTAAQKADRDRLREKSKPLNQTLVSLSQKMSQFRRPPADAKQRAEWERKRTAVNNEYRAQVAAYMKIHEELQKYEPAYEKGGFV